MANALDINTKNYLGYDYNNHIRTLQQYALSNTREYFTARNNVERNVKENFIDNITKDIKSILQKGTFDGESDNVFGDNVKFNWTPNYSQQKINSIIISFAETLDPILDKIIDILMPQDITGLVASKKLGDLGKIEINEINKAP